ncbi:MAG: hypothetical protein IJL92_03470 [Thermoguttaceae bacterium]|nr:hypothetical protein [Thermoguttaceae bacterium]
MTVGGTATISDNTATAGDYGAILADGAVTVTGDATITNNSAAGSVGAISATGDVTISGVSTITGNKATGNVGAIKAFGNVTILGAAVISGNQAGGDSGALDVDGKVSLRNATITNNVAGGKAGAINASFVEIVNSLVADNVAAGDAGAIYVSELTLLNVTVAGNTAANGGALYVEKTATIDNSILAGNSVTEGGEGVEIYALADAAITLRNSLIQNIESTGANAFGIGWLVEEYRSFYGTDPLFVDAANGDYTLKANSPIINAGSNELAATVGDFDLAGNARYAGLVAGGKVYAIDLGAYEFQTITAPDLAFGDDPINFWYGTLNDVANNFYYAGQDVVLDFGFINRGDATVVDKFNVSFTIDGVTADGSAYSDTIVYRYAKGSDFFDWLKESNWIKADETVVYERQNLGNLAVGVYTLTITLDVDGEIVEYGEEDGSEVETNNVYSTSFEVHEAPSVVVTTDEDGEYNALDDKITLREAVELYAGPSWHTYHVLLDAAEFVDADYNRVNVDDGVATSDYNVATVNGVEQVLADGDSFAYSNTYIAYDPATATFTYPDGTVEPYARTSTTYSLTLTLEDGSEVIVKPESMFEYLESIGEPYSDSDLTSYVDVVIAPDGSQTLLSELPPEGVVYGTRDLTYRSHVATDESGVATSLADGDVVALVNGETGTFKNGAVVKEDGSYVLLNAGDSIVVDGATLTWIGAAFVCENGDGSATPFEDGASVELLDGTLVMGVAQTTILGEIDTAEGNKVTFKEDGSTILAIYVGSDVTFSDRLRAEAATITLNGSQITIAKDLTIDATGSKGTERITVDANAASRIFAVNANVTAAISSLNLTNGSAATGGAIANYGTLTLNNSTLLGNQTVSDGTIDSDKILREGLGGAIYNSGTLTVNGGRFIRNTSAFFGGAIYSVGALNVDGTSFTGNKSNYNGGAIFVLNSDASIANANFTSNVASRNGGAVGFSIARNAGALSIVNSKLVNNVATSANGGAIYAYAGASGAANVSLVNDTIASNSAVLGGGVYAENATIALANTIVATNSASDSGVDLALVEGSTASVTRSIVGNGESGVNEGALTIANSFVGTTESPIDPVFGEDFALTAASPAINTGANDLAVYADGSAIEFDVNGDERIVGVEKDGAIYSVDMGAVEFQTVVAPDLTFPTDRPVLNGWYASVDGVSSNEFVEGWDVCFDYVFGNYGTASLFNSFNFTIVVTKLDENGQAIEGSEKTYVRTYGEEVNGFLVQDQWLVSGQDVTDVWNLGTFDAGRYAVTLTLDTGDVIYETNETNNVYSTTFAVAERPNLIVTTPEDVVNRYDGVTSLREAVGRVSETGEFVMTATRPLANGDTFTLGAYEELGIADGTIATYADGALTYVDAAGETVALQANVEYPLSAGGAVSFDGDHTAVLSETYGKTITFDPSVYGSTITLVDGELVIDRNMEIAGDGSGVTIDANGARAFMVAHGDEIIVRGLTVANASAELGAAIYNAANLTLTNMAFNTNNAALGGAIYNANSATIDASDVSFTANRADEGGAIYSAGELVLNNATFVNNAATTGAAVYTSGFAAVNGAEFSLNVASDRAGAIFNAAGELEVADASFLSNSAQYGGAIVNYQGVVSVNGSVFANNVAGQDAGAIDNYGQLSLTDVEFSHNAANGYGGAIYNSMSSSTSNYLVELNGVSFTGNSAVKGGAVYNSALSTVEVVGATSFTGNSAIEDGGAVYNLGSLVSDAALGFSTNFAEGDGGALYNGANAKSTLVGASFVGNTASSGGAVYNGGVFNATTTNFESNGASTDGGAINAVAGAVTSVSNSLIWKNNAGQNGGAIVSAGSLRLRSTTIGGNSAAVGGGLSTSGSAMVYNTIVANNYATTGVDVYSTKSINMYYSLLGATTGSNVAPTMIQSKTGDAGFVVAPEFADGVLTNASAIDLSLNSDSAAVNSGNDVWALDATGVYTLEKDYAGNSRIYTSLDSIDMGAFEYRFEEPSTVVTTGDDVYDLTDGVISLREAIDYAVRLGKDTVTIPEDLTEATLNSTLEINVSIKIVSEAEDGLTISANNFVGSVITVGSTREGQNAEVELENLTITGGYFVNALHSDDPNFIGGGLCNYATLTLTNVSVDGNSATYGGGVYNAGDLKVIGSTITNNKASYYGGVYNRGSLYVEDSTIAGNSAQYYGGGLGTYTGATIVNTTVLGNYAASGAGIYQQINATDLLMSDADMSVNIVNSTIVGNAALEGGAGVWANHILNIDNSIVYGNKAAFADDVYFTTIFTNSKATYRYSNIGTSNAAITGVGVKSVDPGFISFEAPATNTAAAASGWADWNLSLTLDSAMIDAGSNDLAVGADGVLTTDHAGLARIVNASVDMGAYEEQGNQAPTDVTITIVDGLDASVQQGDVIATLSAVDPNADDTFTYEIVSDTSGALAIDGDTIVVDGELAPGDYSVTVRATDEGGASVEKTVEFTVADPSATNYATPTITMIGVSTSGDLVVAWSTDDPAKEYVVEYRVKGASSWSRTSALTGEFGAIENAKFNIGDVVQARIKAATSSTKNESKWSEIVEYEIAAPTPSYNVTINENAIGAYHVASVVIESNADAYAWWSINWGDGATTSVTGLSMSQTLSHIYTASGVYSPVLFVDNQEGVALNAIVVDIPSTSGARLDAVFSVASAAPVFKIASDELFVEAEDVEADQISVDALAPVASERSSVAIDNFFADMAQDDVELETELDDAIFNDDFLGGLFEE